MKRHLRIALRAAALLTVFAYCALVWVALIAWVAGVIADAQTGSWRDMPPARYQGVATAPVIYQDGDTIRRVCGRGKVACYWLGYVHMPNACGSGMTTETVNVALMMRDTSYCASIRAHEWAHVLGWPADHPR